MNTNKQQTNSMVRKLIIECDKHDATIIKLELANAVPTALIENNNGTSTLLFYENDIWYKWF
jgi:hypothetical protein